MVAVGVVGGGGVGVVGVLAGVIVVVVVFAVAVGVVVAVRTSAMVTKRLFLILSSGVFSGQPPTTCNVVLPMGRMCRVLQHATRVVEEVAPARFLEALGVGRSRSRAAKGCEQPEGLGVEDKRICRRRRRC